MTTTVPRQRISQEFLAANRRRRIIDGLAEAIVEKGYRGAHIADIVRASRCARKTFYDTFGGKSEAGQALLSDVSGVIERNPEGNLRVVLAVEVAALWRSGSRDTALDQAEEARRLIRSAAEHDLPEPADDEALQQTLPPGKHNLPAEFVRANHRRRLLSGLAEAVAENGYAGTTIAHITRQAAVSRRTFYEHFESLDDAALALFTAAGMEWGLQPNSALRAVLVETVAYRIARTKRPSSPAQEADTLLRVLIGAFETAEMAGREGD